MKRFISILLIITMLSTSVLVLNGCSIDNNSVITMGQWLVLVNQAFGMESYSTEEPFFANVSTENQYFDAVQIAAEWEVIDSNDAIDVNKALTWKDALLTLVNVGNFIDNDESEETKIEYAIKTFDSCIRKYWMNRAITPEKAVSLLNTAQKLWANRTYSEIIEEAKYKDGVKDFTQGEKKVQDYKVENGVVIIPKNENVEIKSGETYVLPSTKDNPIVSVYKASTVNEDGNYIYINNASDELTLEDVAEDIFIQETFIPQAENAVVYDANGNVLSVGSNVVVPQSYTNDADVQITNLLNTKKNTGFTPLYDAQAIKAKHTFTVGGWQVSLGYDLNGALDFDFTVETPNMLSAAYQKEHPSQELTLEFGAQLSDFKVTNDVDYKLFKLRSASLRVDYEQKGSATLKYGGKPVNKLLAPEYRNDGNFLNNWSKKVWKDANGDGAKGAKTIKIGSVDLYTVGVARVCLDINFSISAEGSITISLTQRGTKGVEYKNGKMRLINICDKDVDVDLKGKAEATIGVGPALYVVGLKKPIIGLEIKAGFGVAINIKFNLVDSQNHLLEDSEADNFSTEFTDLLTGAEIYSDAEQIKQIAESQGCTYDIVTSGKVKCHCDVCMDGSLYFILRISVTDTSYIAGLLNDKITTSWEAFGQKNGKLLNIHIDNTKVQFGYPGKKVKCTLEYVPFDNSDMDERNEEVMENEAILKGDSIILNEMFTSLQIGNKHYIQLMQLPEGYTENDLVCISSDESVATVTSDGVVTAKELGSTIITVMTKDKKYSVCLAVTVVDPYAENFEGLSSVGQERNDL